MKKEAKRKLINFTHDILDFFLGIPESFAAGFDRSEFYRTMQGMPSDKVLTCSNICKIFNNFKKDGYIRVDAGSGGIESVTFTNKAKLAVIDRLTEKLPFNEEYCLVSFDIPERLKTNRNQFRRAIKRMGFKQIQKSLWASRKRLGDLVDLASDEYGVSEYVVYFISARTNMDKFLSTILPSDTRPNNSRLSL